MTQKEKIEAFVERILSFKHTIRDDQCLVVKFGDRDASPIQQEGKKTTQLECKLIRIMGVKVAIIVKAQKDSIRSRIPRWILSKHTATKVIQKLNLLKGSFYLGVFTCSSVMVRWCRFIPFRAGRFYNAVEFTELYEHLLETNGPRLAKWAN